jgi:hypothetical protein
VLFSYENLYRQYLACRRNKRNTANALKFEARQEQNLLELQTALENRSYSPSRSVCFCIRKPKLREVFAADFRDRVVHHVLVDHLEQIWEPLFIHDSYACRKGKGVHAGVHRLQTFIRRETANGTRPAWYLQLDIRNYFMSIDKQLLFNMLAPRIRDEDALWLTRLLVFHDCTQNYFLKGDPQWMSRIPPHKTLFGTGPGKGLPIGNLNSQFFANVYLNALDQFAKHTLKCHHYLRYCDDLVLLAQRPEQLVEWRERIRVFLRDRLRLELNDARERLRRVGDGVDFLGYIVRADYLLVRQRVVGNMEERLAAFEREMVKEESQATRYSHKRTAVARLEATVASYLGHFRLANTHRLCRQLWTRHPFLYEYLVLDGSMAAARRRHVPRRDFRRAGQQFAHFRREFPGEVVLMKVGAFVEFYAPDPAKSQGAGMNLQAMRPTRRGARHGFPLPQLSRRVNGLLARGRSVVFVDETGRDSGRLRERAVRWRFVARQPPLVSF